MTVTVSCPAYPAGFMWPFTNTTYCVHLRADRRSSGSMGQIPTHWPGFEPWNQQEGLTIDNSISPFVRTSFEMHQGPSPQDVGVPMSTTHRGSALHPKCRMLHVKNPPYPISLNCSLHWISLTSPPDPPLSHLSIVWCPAFLIKMQSHLKKFSCAPLLTLPIPSLGQPLLTFLFCTFAFPRMSYK